MSTSGICNFRCRMCHIWMNQDRQDELSVARRVEIVREFAALNPGGTVFIPGGEVTLDPPQLFALASACRAEGLACGIVTNGSRIVDEEFANALVASGLTSISVSLDSQVPAVHEYMRGMPGCFAHTIRAIRLLLQARAAHNPRLTVRTSCVLCRLNIETLPGYLQFCADLGVDHAGFQLLSGTFSNRSGTRDDFFDKHFWHDAASKARAKAVIEGVLTPGETRLRFEERERLAWMQRYIDDPHFETGDPVCGSHERNLMIDPQGNAALCFGSKAILEEPYLGNVATSDVRALWTGDRARAARLVMDRCRLSCGTLHCHRRPPRRAPARTMTTPD
ncbi:MAG: radical SAM protein [Vicinamibacterales bacterium]